VPAVLLVLLDFAVVLPGNVTSTFWGGVGRVAIEALLVWRLWHGSEIAWVIAVGFAVLTLPTIILIGGPIDAALYRCGIRAMVRDEEFLHLV
jgi:hypothetical protein